MGGGLHSTGVALMICCCVPLSIGFTRLHECLGFIYENLQFENKRITQISVNKNSSKNTPNITK